MGSSDMAAQEQFGSSGSNGVDSAGTGISPSAGGVQFKDDQFSSGNDFTPKVRKPYTIKKERERWTEEEHKKFLEALKLYGRAWRKIEEHIGTKTAVQIRSHAQKFFSKVARYPNGGNATSEEPIDIPPPRPKKKPMRPYPRKLVHPLDKETSIGEQPTRSRSPNLSVSEQENQSPTSVLSVIGSDALGSTDSNTPSDGLSPDSSAAGVNSENLIHSEPNPLLEESGSPINNCSLPNEQLTMKLELFPTDDVDASGGSAKEAFARSLKLFGRTVLVTDSHRPSSRAAGTSQSLPSDVQEEKPEQTSLPFNFTDMESASGNVEHVWDNFPYGGHQGIYIMQFQNQNSDAVESGTNAYPVPWWTVCPPFIPFHKQQQQPVNEHVDSKKVDGEAFVFFNGQNVYDNNDAKDFCITVEGGMDLFAFEDFLLEEKRKEQEKLAKEQAERERQAEEQRRIEAEKAASEADRAQAKAEIVKRRQMVQELIKKAVRSVEDVWHIEPKEFKGEDLVKLYYNRSSGPLANAKELWIHGGHNGWKDGLSIVERLVSSERKDGDWWYANVVVPERAVVLDWVFADGPPQNAVLYDNNHRHDFHAIVPKSIPEELYWVEEEHQIHKKLQEERRLREEAIRAKAERTARMKAEMKERTLKRFLLSQKHIVYTEPLDVQAGNKVTVFYNPANTVLNGKPEVWFRGSFNRWTHRKGPLQPQKMLPSENGSHVKTTVSVPLDAYMMDFVFSETEDGGLFDNKNGMDYHIPVFGGVVKQSPMNIVHISVEMAPIAKVGGLGDVVTSLSRAVQDLNHHVDIILPKYDCLNLSNVKEFQYNRGFFWGGTEIKVWFGKVEGVSVYFLEPQNRFFHAGCIYGCKNDAERFGFFCHAALEFLLQSGFHPDIIHCHDWSSAPVAWLFKDHYMHYGLSKARVVFTIHNLEFGAPVIGKAVAYSDKSTTVSNTYAKEVSGNPAVAPHLYKFHGIINGIDQDIWDPYNDKFIPLSYTSENVVEGKQAAKEALQRRLGLKTADLPVVGIITRLTHQKGIHLIKHAIWRTLERNGQVVLLGSAPDPRIQNDFVNLANQLHSSHGDRARLCLTYDEPLSHLIYAGADFILVPSIFEPCGLTQLIAMRYGSIPVVRKTGGQSPLGMMVGIGLTRCARR